MAAWESEAGELRLAVATIAAFACINFLCILIDNLSRQKKEGSDSKGKREFKSQAANVAFREALADLMRETLFGRIWNLFQGFLAGISAFLFVIGTYTPRFDVEFNKLEVAISFLFLSDFVLSICMAEKRLSFLWTVSALVDFVTFCPGLLVYFFFQSSTADLGFMRFIRITRGLSLIRSTVSKSVFKIRREDDVDRRIRILVFTVLCLMFIASSLMYSVENSSEVWVDSAGKEVRWHDSVYYLVVTMGTIGYGDIVPKTSAGRMLALVLIGTTLTLVPMQVNRLIALLQMRTPWSRSVKPSKTLEHVIVCGNLTFSMISDFLAEFFHKDRVGQEQWKVVFLCPDEPKRDTEILLSTALYEHRSQYLVGSPLIYEDLMRVRALDAKACFVLANKTCKSPDNDDQATFLRTWAFKNCSRSLPTFVQVLRSRNERHLRSCLTPADAYYSLERMKMNILAKSCLSPGFSTLIGNLIRSDDLETDHLPKAYWKREYCSGCGYEIYGVELPPQYYGMRFADAAVTVFEHFGITMFAMRSALASDSDHSVLLNPCDEPISPLSRVFVIASSAKDALAVSRDATDDSSNLRYLVRFGRAITSLSYLPWRSGPSTPSSHSLCRAPLPPTTTTTADSRSDSDELQVLVSPPERAGPLTSAATQSVMSAGSPVKPYAYAQAQSIPRPQEVTWVSSILGAPGGPHLPNTPVNIQNDAVDPDRDRDRDRDLDKDKEKDGENRERGERRGEQRANLSPSPSVYRNGYGGGQCQPSPRAAPELDNFQDGDVWTSPSTRKAPRGDGEVFQAGYDLRHNVLVCGAVHGLHHFVKVLRDPDLRHHKPIVILDPNPVADEIWFDIAQALRGKELHGTMPVEQTRQICREANVYSVQGSALIVRDLQRAGIALSDVVLILTDERQTNDSGAGYDERMVDAAALMTVKLIESKFCDKNRLIRLHTLANLMYASNGAFLQMSRDEGYSSVSAHSPLLLDSSAQLQQNEAAAAYARFMGVSPPKDSDDFPRHGPARHAFRQPSENASVAFEAAPPDPASLRRATMGIARRVTQAVTLKMVPNGAAASEEAEDKSIFNGDATEKLHLVRPHYAAGRVYWSTMLDTYVHQAFYNPEVFSIVRQLVSPKEHVQLIQIPVPQDFHGLNYMRLFRFLASDKKLPLALYRCKRVSTSSKYLNPLPYVYTNPSPDTVIDPLDRVFVLVSKHHPDYYNLASSFDQP